MTVPLEHFPVETIIPTVNHFYRAAADDVHEDVVFQFFEGTYYTVLFFRKTRGPHVAHLSGRFVDNVQ